MRETAPASAGEPDYRLDDFRRKVEKLRSKFQPAPYTELIGESNHTLVVPEGVAGRQDLGLDGLYARQQMFVYKNKESGIVIIMSLSAASSRKSGKEWKHSSDYVSGYYNAKEGKYADSYDPGFPAADMASYSFEAEGVSVELIALSHAGDSNTLVTELASFTKEVAELF